MKKPIGQTKDEVREEVAHRELQQAISQLVTIEKQLLTIKDCFDYNLASEFNDNAAKQQYLSWLDRIEASGYEDLKTHIKNNGFRATFTTAPVPGIVQYPNPHTYMQRLKPYLETAIAFLRTDNEKITHNIEDLEERVHRLKVDRLTLQYGEGSVKLTQRNIKISLWVPVVVFVTTLLATILFESFKTETTEFIRHLFGK